MVRETAPIPMRTEENEDCLAFELLILEFEGPDALARYQYRWSIRGRPR